MPRGIMGLVGVSTASHTSRTTNVPEVRLDSLLLSVTSKPPNTGYSDPITSAKFLLMFSQAMYDVKKPLTSYYQNEANSVCVAAQC